MEQTFKSGRFEYSDNEFRLTVPVSVLFWKSLVRKERIKMIFLRICYFMIWLIVLSAVLKLAADGFFCSLNLLVHGKFSAVLYLLGIIPGTVFFLNLLLHFVIHNQHLCFLVRTLVLNKKGLFYEEKYLWFKSFDALLLFSNENIGDSSTDHETVDESKMKQVVLTSSGVLSETKCQSGRPQKADRYELRNKRGKTSYPFMIEKRIITDQDVFFLDEVTYSFENWRKEGNVTTLFFKVDKSDLKTFSITQIMSLNSFCRTASSNKLSGQFHSLVLMDTNEVGIGIMLGQTSEQDRMILENFCGEMNRIFRSIQNERYTALIFPTDPQIDFVNRKVN